MCTIFSKTLLSVALAAACVLPHAQACTRALYVGAEQTVITGRSMDWMEDMQTNLWAFPRGIERNGLAGKDSVSWTSRYGSVVASVYQLASADGMNEKGLVANLLYLTESDYGKKTGRSPLSISLWGQYVLDNFATVKEAVEGVKSKPLYLASANLPNGKAATVHLSISDPSGDSAIFEYVDGQLVIHHGPQYQVMTNSPIYSKQLALNEYWKEIGGTVFLPGTNRAADRFARTSFFLDAVPKVLDKNYIQSVPGHAYPYQAMANVLSIMRAVSVPLGITTPNVPNIASTIWRTVSDQKNRVYYFDSSTSPSLLWVSLDQLNFNEGAPVLSLTVSEGQVYAGEVAKQFKPTPPFQFMSVIQ